MPIVSRRQFLTTGGAVSLLSGCAPKCAKRTQTSVSILRCPDYRQDLYGELRRVLAEHHLKVRGKRVLLKPNLVEFEPEAPIHTHPLLVHAAFEAFRALGADVVIGEGPGHRRNTLDLADAAGYFDTIPQFEGHFIDLNLDRVVQRRLTHPHSRLTSIYLAESAFNCDLLVSLPKMKTHHWAGATLSMKNLFGVVPGAIYGWPKNILHWSGIPECVADLYNTLPRHFAIVDGIVGMEGNGPIQGTARRAGVVVSGRDLAAVDATCCRLMSIDPCRIEYLRLAAGDVDGLFRSVRQIGEPVAETRSRFELIPEWSAIRLAEPA
ncbi:MAG: DUF362 domain-containing protein [Bryobacteraceae bacterium]